MTEQLHPIAILGLPTGYRAVEVMIDPMSCNYIGDDGCTYITAKIKIEKIKPHRIVLEETEEKHLGCQTLSIDDTEFMIMTDKVWREVKETDTPLNNSEPKLSLSVDECKEAMRKLETFNVTDLSVKICRFLKEHS